INSLQAYRISVDIPSGLNATDGSSELCVKADETITMGFAKTGFYKKHGSEACGKVKIADIGL
ncbi:MAG: NAD(P)H-hydrate epimerase, partial [Candidatus Omnitrophota bacterium]